MTSLIRRRHWLALLVFGAGSFTLAFRQRLHGHRSAAVKPPADDPARPWLSVFRSPERLRQLGRAYLAQYRDRGSAQAGFRASPFVGDANDKRRWLRTQVEHDFAEGRVTRVDGWLLSQNEAELCAAAARSAGDHTRG